MRFQIVDKFVFNLGFIALLCCTLALAGCLQEEPPLSPTTSLPEEADEAVVVDDSNVDEVVNEYRPIAVADCEALETEVEVVLGVDVLREDAAGFQSAISDFSGESCQLRATGTGEDFTNFIDVTTDLIALFEAKGWMQDPQYVADGPTGTVIGLRQSETIGDNGLAIISVNWDPAPGAECPEDEPISTCAEQLEPAQMLYDITIDVVAVG